jgi:hypothetical protein
MKMDDWLMVVVLSGLVMSCSYIVAEYLSWRSHQISEVKALLGIGDLYKRIHSVTKPLARVFLRTRGLADDQNRAHAIAPLVSSGPARLDVTLETHPVSPVAASTPITADAINVG